jgi:hypothetical protein
MGNAKAAEKKEKYKPPPYIIWQSHDEFFIRLTGDLTLYTKPKKKITQSNKRDNAISKKTQSRIRNYVNLLLDTAIEKEIYSEKENRRFIYKIGFCTLTIPPDFDHDDQFIHYKIFKPFIRVLQDKYNLAEYIWKAETQENGKLHYHLTINQWVHWFIINREWRKQIQKHGYNYGTEKRKRAATEIHSVKKVKNLAAYLCKYLAKNDEWKKKTPKKIIDEYSKCPPEQKKEFLMSPAVQEWRKRIPNIKLWDCSTSLKKEKLTLRNIVSDYGGVCIDLANITTDEIQKDFFSLCIYDGEVMKETKSLGTIWKEYINRIRQPDKQKPLYTIKTLKYEDSSFTYN